MEGGEGRKKYVCSFIDTEKKMPKKMENDFNFIFSFWICIGSEWVSAREKNEEK